MRHPLSLLTHEVRSIELNRQHTLVLLQDLHAPFADPEAGWLAETANLKVLAREFDEYFEAMRLITPNISRMVTAGRNLGLAVAFSCLGHQQDESPSAWQESTGWEWDLTTEHGEFPVAWSPNEREPVFSKPGWGALSNNSFRTYLSEKDIRSVIILGAMLDFGIRHTCYELSDSGIGSLVISDGVAALTRAGHAATAGNIAHGLTKLRSTAEVLDLLARIPKQGSVLV